LFRDIETQEKIPDPLALCPPSRQIWQLQLMAVAKETPAAHAGPLPIASLASTCPRAAFVRREL